VIYLLPIPTDYSSSDKINFTEVVDYKCSSIVKILKREVQQRKEKGGIILYCVERNKNESDDDTPNQTAVYTEMIKKIKTTGLDIVSVYNSDGIKVFFRLKKQRAHFENTLELKNT
jgi:hypothetical protein